MRGKPQSENPLGTMLSIEHTLCSLDKHADQGRESRARLEKTLAESGHTLPESASIFR